MRSSARVVLPLALPVSVAGGCHRRGKGQYLRPVATQAR